MDPKQTHLARAKLRAARKAFEATGNEDHRQAVQRAEAALLIATA